MRREIPPLFSSSSLGVADKLDGEEHRGTDVLIGGLVGHVSSIGFDEVDDLTIADNAKILKGVFDGQIVYFIKSDGANMTYKTTDENVGTTMYFTIRFVDYTTSS